MTGLVHIKNNYYKVVIIILIKIGKSTAQYGWSQCLNDSFPSERTLKTLTADQNQTLKSLSV